MRDGIAEARWRLTRRDHRARASSRSRGGRRTVVRHSDGRHAKPNAQPQALERDSARAGDRMTMDPIYCPHCSRPFAEAADGSAPEHPVRCPHCRLLVGAGRARPSPDRGQPGAAAGLIANEARRNGAEGDNDEVDRARASAAIVYVASRLGVSPDRLTLTVYREQLPREESLPSETDIV